MAKKCPQCGSSLPKRATEESVEHCTNCSTTNKKNTNKKKGENRNQSFDGETHQKTAKGGHSRKSNHR